MCKRWGCVTHSANMVASPCIPYRIIKYHFVEHCDLYRQAYHVKWQFYWGAKLFFTFQLLFTRVFRFQLLFTRVFRFQLLFTRVFRFVISYQFNGHWSIRRVGHLCHDIIGYCHQWLKQSGLVSVGSILHIYNDKWAAVIFHGFRILTKKTEPHITRCFKLWIYSLLIMHVL